MLTCTVVVDHESQAYWDNLVMRALKLLGVQLVAAFLCNLILEHVPLR